MSVNSDLLNLFVHIEEQGGKNNHIILNTAGTILVNDEAEYLILGLYEFKGKIYIATRQILYSYDVITEILTAIDLVDFSASEKVSFADNGIELVVVGNNGYYYNPETEDFGSMEQEGWYPSTMVTYMDGYFIFNRTGTGQFFISELYSHLIDYNISKNFSN